MKHGLTILNEQFYEVDGKDYRIPTRDDAKPHQSPKDAPHWRHFNYADTEPAHVAAFLSDRLYTPAGNRLDQLALKVSTWEQRLADHLPERKPRIMAREVKPLVDELFGVVEAAKDAARAQAAHVQDVKERATALPKPKNDHSELLQALEMNALRQELAAMSKEERAKVLDGMGQDRDRDLLLLNAVGASALKPVPATAITTARERFIERHFPWIRIAEQQAAELVKWTEARAAQGAYHKLQQALPDYLKVDQISALTK